MSFGVPAYREADDVVRKTEAWARSRDDVIAVAGVGSWARREMRPDSDVDLVLLVERPSELADLDGWWAFAGASTTLIRRQSWGAVEERRVRLASGLEVEFGIASPTWAAVDPVDAGTADVVSDGFVVVYDPTGLLKRLADALAP